MRNVKYVLLVLAAFGLLVAGCDREITGDVEMANQSSSNCFECHSDSDWDILHAQDQYAVSKHASGDNTERNRLYNSRYQGCEQCHTHEGYVANLNDMSADGDHFVPINCFTCHAPHTNGNLQLRVTSAITLEDGTTYDRGKSNLCASCHHARRDVNTYVADNTELSSHFGPHYSNQSDMLIGTGGYEYAGYDYETSAHGQIISNGCVTCHMADASAWAEIGGHTWNMEDHSDSTQNIGACEGCHETFTEFNTEYPAGIDYDYDGISEGVQDEVDGLADSLATLLLAAGLLTQDGDDIHPTEDLVVSTADSVGAVYNYMFYLEDHSHGIHNTDYVVGLLNSAINFMNTGDPNGASAGVGPVATH